MASFTTKAIPYIIAGMFRWTWCKIVNNTSNLFVKKRLLWFRWTETGSSYTDSTHRTPLQPGQSKDNSLVVILAKADDNQTKLHFTWLTKCKIRNQFWLVHCGIWSGIIIMYSILWVSGEKYLDIIQNWSENDQGANSYFVLLSQYIENLTSFVHWQEEVNKIEGPLSTTRTLEIRRTICMKQIIECTW